MSRAAGATALATLQNRALVESHLRANPCVDCGERDPIVLEFDHVRGEKTADVSQLMRGSTEVLRAELEKCVVRCGNCHRMKTAREEGWWIWRMTRGAPHA